MIKVLNLYAGIGGNRKLWTDVDVTAVEMSPEIAKIYQDFFPDDTVIVADAHQYLLEHYKEFDFIWSSPPCPSHSRARYWGSFGGKYELVYPDMKLYQEILFLKHYSKNKWLVENVKPYYDVLIPAKEIARHLFWSNFYISSDIKQDRPDAISISKDPTKGRVSDYAEFDLSGYKLNNRKDKILRNCVDPKIGLHILNQALERMDTRRIQQTSLDFADIS